MKLFELLRLKGKCCVSGKPLIDSEHLTMIQLDFSPAWDYPHMENVLHPQLGRHAVAFVHDDCVVEGKIAGKINYAIEIRGEEIIYHDVPEIRRCRVCGCHELDACCHPLYGNCCWVEKDLCSHCRDYPGEAKRYTQLIRESEEKQFDFRECICLQ